MKSPKVACFTQTLFKSHHFLHAHCYALEGIQFYLLFKKNKKINSYYLMGFLELHVYKKLGGIPHMERKEILLKGKHAFLLTSVICRDANTSK